MLTAIKHTYHFHKIRVISFFNWANPFSGVCSFRLYDICNRHELTFACCSGKVYVLFYDLSKKSSLFEIEGVGTL